MSEIKANVYNDLPFTQTPNETARDKNLSLEARGALTYLLSHSTTFKFNINFLMKEFGIGRDKLLRITNELKTYGYLEITHIRDKGKFVSSKWKIYGVPNKTVIRENRDTENTDVGKNRTTENTDKLQKKSFKEEKFKEKEENSTTTSKNGIPVNPGYAERLEAMLEWMTIESKEIALPYEKEYPKAIEQLWNAGLSDADVKKYFVALIENPKINCITPRILIRNFKSYQNGNGKTKEIDWAEVADNYG